MELELLSAKVNKKGTIVSNLKEVESQLEEFLSSYRGIIVTEDTLLQSKKDLSEIRKKKDAIDTARKELKKQWMAPFEEFEGKCKKLLELCDKTIDEINSQVKTFENQKKAEKRKLVEEIYENTIGEYREFLPLEAIFDDKWLNVSTKQRDIEFDISEKKTRVMSDINVIKTLKSEIESDILDVYKKSGNSLTTAIERNQQYIQDKEKIQAMANPEIDSESAARREIEKDNIFITEDGSIEHIAPIKKLDDLVENLQTVKLIISKADAQRVQNMLDFEEISYRIIEE